MKANELMIGDWVECVDSTHKKKVYAQIDAIEEGQTCILVKLDNCNWFLDISFIKPIPLEKIHLAKNRFTADEEDETFIYEDGYEVRVTFDGGCKELELEPYIYLNINFAEKHLSMEIENLHQLQQAMRIMGCDKEIEL